MLFRSQFTNRPYYKGEENNDESLVEVAGYIPMERRIQNIMDAGQRLIASRTEAYDFMDGKDDGRPIDPMRNLGLDPADASQQLAAIQSRYDAQVAADAAAKATAEAEKNQIHEPVAPVV